MKISSRQLLLFLACIAPVGKMILMPSQLVYYAKNDLILSATLNYALQTAVVFCVLLLSRQEKTFFELLKETFGKTVARVVFCVFALFLLYAALLPLLEQKLFVQSVFYDTLPSTLSFAPFFLFSAYLCCQPLASFGRTWDILAPCAIVGYLGIVVLSLGQTDFGALLPIGASGARGIFQGTAYSMSWFFDSVLLLMLMGRFDYQKGLAWKGALCYAVGGFAVLFFLAVFYGVFSDIAIRQLFAFAKISKYFAGITVLGRIDYLFIFTLALVMAFYCALPLQAATECMKEAFSRKKTFVWIVAILISALMFAVSASLDFTFLTTLRSVSQSLFWIFPLLCVLLPVIALLLWRNHGKDKKIS